MKMVQVHVPKKKRVRMTMQDFCAKLALHHMKQTRTYQQEGENTREEI